MAGSISAARAIQLVKLQSGFLISCWMWPGTRASVLCVNRIQFTGRSYQLSPGETQPLSHYVLAIRARDFHGLGWATIFRSSLGKLEQHSHGWGIERRGAGETGVSIAEFKKEIKKSSPNQGLLMRSYMNWETSILPFLLD